MLTALSRTIANEDDLAAHIGALVRVDSHMGKVADAAGHVPLRWMEHGFAGLVWVIMGQQISTSAARAIHDRLETALGTITPETVLAASDEALRVAGLSIQKIRTIRASAQYVQDGFDLTSLVDMDAEDAVTALTAIKGVGRWTAEVYLLFALGHTDIFPAGDLALQEAARVALELDERPKEKAVLALAEAWRPHRSAAARLLWAYYRVLKGGRDGAPV
ncbi:DNA-3-methyladenine glycosylase family protein [Flaviflagellibacter deserti]|uniref:DNA-3-methyladenine glycosylase II n=1 Tax=Flaviflagellibacter deserti TaxID=2267266 RepID=A0ABV9Z3V1_9HYPH